MMPAHFDCIATFLAGATHAAPSGLRSISLSPAVMVCVNLGLITLSMGMLACIFRLIRGPHLADRSLAVDTFGIHLIGVVILLSLKMQTAFFIDGILVLALLSFAGTVSLAIYIGRPHLKRKPMDQGGPAMSGTDKSPLSWKAIERRHE